MPSLSAYAIVGGVAALVTFVCIPIVIRFSPRLGAVVEPTERHVHTRPTPTAGGAAMMLVYGAMRQDIVIILAQLFGFTVYARNLWLIHVERRDAGLPARPRTGEARPGARRRPHGQE